MLDIKIGKLKIASDEKNFIVAKRMANKKTNKEYWVNTGYYPTFEMAAGDLIESHISDLDAKNLREVISAINELKTLVADSQR